MDGFSQLNKNIFRSYIHHIYYILIKPGGMKQICRVSIKYNTKLRFESSWYTFELKWPNIQPYNANAATCNKWKGENVVSATK